jgi:iron complex transport system substrate-binding protein
VVGVTRYCNYPPEAQQKMKVGGYHDPNFEAIVGLNPDLVIMLTGHERTLPGFQKLGLNTLVVCHKNVDGILDSITKIGQHTDTSERAEQIVSDLRARMDRIRRKTAGLPRPRVLLAIDRTPDRGRLEDVFVVGSDGFFDKMIQLAGGENALPPGTVRFPIVSAESILWVNPQVIIDMSSGLAQGQHDQEKQLADWRQLTDVEAVETGRVYALWQDYAFVPGPRFILLVEQLARLIHPEVDWD